MTTTTEISFLIGAGFSVEAGIPTRNEINSKLKDLQWEDFIIGSEATTYFLQKPDPNSHWVNVTERKFIQALISFYNSFNNEFDYENFYDYCYKIHDGQKDLNFEVFFKKYQSDHPSLLDKQNALSISIRTIDYLVNDLLKFNSDLFSNNIIDKYYPFINLIKQLILKFDKVNIYSLNHDLLLEAIFQTELDFDYSDGFEINGSNYFIKTGGEQVRIKRFKNEFGKKICLYKLHGSIDHYIYNFSEPFEMVKIPKKLYAPDLHRETFINEQWKVENCWTLYEPEFLSGTTSKILNYDKHPFYSNQFAHFKNSLKKSKFLICIGYGLEDEKINEFIKAELNKLLKVLVVKRTNKPLSFFKLPNVFHYGIDLGIADIEFEKVKKYL
ncbi:MAG: hypothetical protein EOP00_02690 [Pedobacter sp.]|nr:MAG: hypothetical protein EOP00_02690 [Pedobacter sp.]